MIATRPLHRFFGAIVEGVDLTKRINDETFTRLRNALTEFSVLVFPGQEINDAPVSYTHLTLPTNSRV